MLKKIFSAEKRLFLFIRSFRYRRYLKLLDRDLKTLLDLGCSDGEFVKMASAQGYQARGTDIENKIESNHQSADIVTCFQTLEHVEDPVATMRQLAQLPWKQLIISVPNEPWFSLWRLGWQPDHLWAITRASLLRQFGTPSFEKVFFLNRYYLAVWRK